MSYKLFLVDDDAIFSEMMKDHLSKNKNYSIRHFSTGEECLDQLYEKPDVVILDFNLNSVSADSENGLAILEKIKRSHPSTHVIMLSSQTHYGVAAKTIVKGAEQYVIKDDEAFKSIEAILKDILK